jgi:hypothetical protein
MKPCARRAFAILSVVVTMGCSAASRLADAVVTSHDGRPCFRTGDPAQMQRLQAVIVSDVSKTPATTIWEWTGPAFDQAARGCIAYGERLSGGADASKAVPQLQPGQVYHVFLNLRREHPGDATYGQEAEFCLRAEDGTQGSLVHQIKWDRKPNRKPPEACRAPGSP